MHQEPRNPREEHCFQKGMSTVSLWFAHAQTYVWMLTNLPEEAAEYGAEYSARGWPTFERAVSDMLTESCKLLDLGSFDEETCTSWFKTSQVCSEARRTPIVPEAFSAELAKKVFTQEEDRPMIDKMYAQTFMEVMSVAKVLKYKCVGWTIRDIATFA